MRFGICVSPGFLPSVDEVRELRPRFIRSIIYSMDDIEPLLAYHLPLLITLNNQAQEVGPDWSGWDQAVEMVAERGQGQVFNLAVGNEFDLWWQNDPSNVPPAFAANLVRRAAAILRPRGIKTVATSVVGRDWQGYLAQMAPLCRDEADYFDIHPYGQRPDGWGNPGWMHGDLRPTLIRARELAGKPVICSEYGVKIGDAGGEAQVAAFLTAGAATVAALGDAVCPYAAWFAWTDGVGAPAERGPAAFGLVADDGRRRPAWHAFAALVDAPPKVVEPPAVEVPPVVEPVIPAEVPAVYPWQYFDAGAIEAASGCPAENILVYWPKIVAQLELCGINDRATQIAAVGTVAIETASTFTPLHEYGNPADWAGYSGGPTYAGRGFIQLTHDYNYRQFSDLVNDLWQAGGVIDLVARPDDAMDPDVSAAVLALYFVHHTTQQGYSIPQAANAGDWTWVRRLVLGGTAGLDRLIAIANALSGAPAPVEQPTEGDPRDERIHGLETAVAHLADVVVPKAARAARDADAAVAEAAAIRLQFLGPAA